MAVVGAMAAFRLLLIKPIFENVLSPQASSNILVFPVPHLGWTLDLNFLVPSHFHNAWSVVAYALVASALVKSVCDYLGTYLANYAGFGMITDLRNDLYDAVLRRSVALNSKCSIKCASPSLADASSRAPALTIKQQCAMGDTACLCNSLMPLGNV